MHDLFIFILGLWSHWAALVTGSAISIVVIIVEKKLRRNIEWKHVIWVMTCAIVVSSFLTWRDEYTSAQWRGTEIARLNGVIEGLQSGRRNKEAIRAGLAQLITAGIAIRDKTSVLDAALPQSVSADWRKWLSEVDSFLRTNLDAGDAETFRSYEKAYSEESTPPRITIMNKIGALEHILDQVGR